MRILFALILSLGLTGCSSDEVTTKDAAVDAKATDAKVVVDALKPALDAAKPVVDAAKPAVDAAATDAKSAVDAPANGG